MRPPEGRDTTAAVRWSLSLVAIALVGCRSADGTWPSLARRAGEPGTAVAGCATPAAGCAAAATPEPPAAPPLAPAATAPAAPSPALDDIPARLDTIARDLADLTSRLAQQRSATDAAVAKAREARSDNAAWSQAQLELSRYQRAGSAVGDVRQRLEAVAGTLAAAAADGADVTALLKATGSLIARTAAAGTEFDTAYAAANSVISRGAANR